MRASGARARLAVLLPGLGLVASAAAAAGPPAAAGSPTEAGPPLASAPPGALSCSGCHGGRAAAETAVPPIEGRPAEEIVAALEAFRTGERPATVMNRIAPGFTPAESRAIAVWLGGRAR